MATLIIRVEHARAAGYCAAGAREFARRHGLDWIDFVHNGIDADQLRGINDAMAEAVIAIAEREAAQNG